MQRKPADDGALATNLSPDGTLHASNRRRRVGRWPRIRQQNKCRRSFWSGGCQARTTVSARSRRTPFAQVGRSTLGSRTNRAGHHCHSRNRAVARSVRRRRTSSRDWIRDGGDRLDRPSWTVLPRGEHAVPRGLHTRELPWLDDRRRAPSCVSGRRRDQHSRSSVAHAARGHHVRDRGSVASRGGLPVASDGSRPASVHEPRSECSRCRVGARASFVNGQHDELSSLYVERRSL